MKFNALLTFVLAGALSAAAQSQGYMDGIEYYKAGQYENAKTILQKLSTTVIPIRLLPTTILAKPNFRLATQLKLRNTSKQV